MSDLEKYLELERLEVVGILRPGDAVELACLRAKYTPPNTPSPVLSLAATMRNHAWLIRFRNANYENRYSELSPACANDIARYVDGLLDAILGKCEVTDADTPAMSEIKAMTPRERAADAASKTMIAEYDPRGVNEGWVRGDRDNLELAIISAIEAAVAEEREACAKVVQDQSENLACFGHDLCERIRVAIRVRGETSADTPAIV